MTLKFERVCLVSIQARLMWGKKLLLLNSGVTWVCLISIVSVFRTLSSLCLYCVRVMTMRCVWFVSQLLPPLSYLLFLHKVHIGGAFDLHRLALPVVQRQHEVEEVGLPQIGRRLLLEVSTG